jgi:hypothetical protein
MKKFLNLAVAGITLTLLPASAASPSWPTDPGQNVPIAAIPITHLAPKITTDGAGGAIIAWQDARWGTTLDENIYAQHVSVQGDVLWTANGIPVSDALGNQEDPQIASDGVGGAIIVWEDHRNGNMDIYAQRVSGNGTAYWDSNGVAICVAENDQDGPRVISDGSGGAVITWTDTRGSAQDIYAQRIDADGDTLWAADGVPICTHSADQRYPGLTTDGASGAIIVWKDMRDSIENIYARRVDADGVAMWTVDGVPISTRPYYNWHPRIASDDAGGAIIGWTWAGSNDDIYAQRVNPDGDTLWPANGVAIAAAADDQRYPQIIPDGESGAIICWSDGRNDVADVYANRIDEFGNILWATDGVPVGVAPNVQGGLQLVPDGVGGAIIAWYDDRNVQFDPDIYAQRMDADGNSVWAANGVAISTAVDRQWIPQLVRSASGGAIITWEDKRRPDESYDEDVYAQQVGPDGTLGNVPTGIAPEVPQLNTPRNYPNPFASSTIIEYELQDPSPIVATIYNIRGQRVAQITSPQQAPGRQTITWNGLDDQGRKVASGVYFYRLEAGRFSQTHKMVIVR